MHHTVRNERAGKISSKSMMLLDCKKTSLLSDGQDVALGVNGSHQALHARLDPVQRLVVGYQHVDRNPTQEKASPLFTSPLIGEGIETSIRI
jgi:hypothetical protein